MHAAAVLIPAISLAAGLACLFIGGHTLVRGASQVALRTKLSPLFIGLTLVACGTSLPELVVTLLADLRDAPDIATGNVVGSNIANLGLVLGTAALVAPLHLQATTVRRDLIISIVATLAVGALALDGSLGRVEAAVLFACFLLYVTFTYRLERSKSDATAIFEALPVLRSQLLTSPLFRALVKVAVGLALLLVGANWTVDGAIEFADRVGLPMTVVGLTVVAVGTSLPEFATSLVAAFNKEPAISVGNVLGSNIFNLLGILGISGATRPIPIAGHIVHFDLPIAAGLSLLCIPILITGRGISRAEGLVLLACYFAYCIWLFTVHGS